MAAYREFFQSLFGFEVPPKCDPTKVLMQLSDILGSTQNSGATAAITEISTKFKAMPDAAYWSALAAAYDGERCPTDELGKHLVFMGVTSEITAPPKDTFYWPHANAKSFKVDQLIAAASKGEGKPVDMGRMYRRAASLSLNGQSIPRAVTAELIRMAVADLSFGIHPSTGAMETPSTEVIERALTPEQSDADTLSQKRNAVRDAALKLLPSDQSVNVAKETERQRFRENIRGARGFLKDSI